MSDPRPPALDDGPLRRLVDPAADRQLDRLGFCVVPLLDPAEVRALRDGYWALTPPGDWGRAIDYLRPDRQRVRAIVDLLAPTWERHLPTVLVDHRPLLQTFVVKHPGPDSDMYLHDDRSYADERRWRSVTLWIPLVDTGPDVPNGGLEVVVGSHRLPVGLSGTATPDAFRPYERWLRDRLEPVAVPAGHALVYDSRLLHGSGANRSDHVREAVVCAAAPVDAPVIHTVAVGRRRRRVYAVDADFFVDHHPAELWTGMPEGCTLLDEREEDGPLRPDQVAAVLGGPPPEPDPVLPADLDLGRPGHRWGRFPTMVAVLADAEPDLQLVVDGATPPGADAGTLSVIGAPVGAIATVRPDAAAAVLGADAAAEVRRRLAAFGPAHPDATIVVIGANARLTVRLASTSDRWWIDPVEAPWVAAGVRAADRVAHLEIGRRVEVPADTLLTWWNDGPGPVVARVTPADTGSRRPLGAGRWHRWSRRG